MYLKPFESLPYTILKSFEHLLTPYEFVWTISLIILIIFQPIYNLHFAMEYPSNQGVN